MTMRVRPALLTTLAAALLSGCDGITSMDNFDPPGSTLTGRVVYQGTPIGVRNAGVELELWQPGPEFELNTKIPVYVAQDGTFSALLFDGNYEINLLPGGPWVTNTTRTTFELRGSMVLDVPVVPYYTVMNESIVNNNDVIQGTFTVGQVSTTGCPLQRVGVYVNTTTIVDRTHQVVRAELSGGAVNLSAPVNVSVALPSNIRLTPSPEPRTAVFARIGVQSTCSGEMAYSQVQKIDI
jgi:hypothetical protein